MGNYQPLPLPGRIPVPNPNLHKKMEELGFIINEDDKYYVTYTIPKGWELCDHTCRKDQIKYYFIDDKSMARIRITGAWWDFGHNLKMDIIEEPFLYEKNLPPWETNYPC